VAAREVARETARRMADSRAHDDRFLTLVFILFYLLFPSNSSAIFATLQCETLYEHPDQPSFLPSDYSVDCSTPFHRNFIFPYACLMVLVYPIGIPAFYIYLLFWRHAKELMLLRALEMERAALHSELLASRDLSRARDNLRRGRKSQLIWTLADLRDARGSFRDASEMEMLSLAEQVQIEKLQQEELRLSKKLPDYVQKLILGYEMRTYYFELIECGRKLSIVCLPVLIQPSGSISQLMFGLCMCFLAFGTHMFFGPYQEDNDDRLAQLCQVQIFFALLSSLALKYDLATLGDGHATTMDIMLVAITLCPIILAFALESGIVELCVDALFSRRTQRGCCPAGGSRGRPTVHASVSSSAVPGADAKGSKRQLRYSVANLQRATTRLTVSFGAGPLGVELQERGSVVKVTHVEVGSQASEQGLRKGSVVVEVGGVAVDDLQINKLEAISGAKVPRTAAVLEHIERAPKPVKVIFEMTSRLDQLSSRRLSLSDDRLAHQPTMPKILMDVGSGRIRSGAPRPHRTVASASTRSSRSRFERHRSRFGIPRSRGARRFRRPRRLPRPFKWRSARRTAVAAADSASPPRPRARRRTTVVARAAG